MEYYLVCDCKFSDSHLYFDEIIPLMARRFLNSKPLKYALVVVFCGLAFYTCAPKVRTTDLNSTKETVAPKKHGIRPVQSVILSGFRSGTTFFGSILNAVPETYYHFEPFSYHDGQIRAPPESTKAIGTIRQLFKCNYTGLKEILQFGKKNQYILEYNTRLWEACKQNLEICSDPKFLNKVCRRFPFHSMKVVRLRANLSEDLLMDPSLNVKITLLIRDPRAIMQSRRKLKWCVGRPDCDDPAILCKDMVSDFRATEVLTKKYPLRFRAMRYEELSLDPYNVTRDILNFFGLPFHREVEEFLDSHTRETIGGWTSTFRDSKKIPFLWMQDLNFDNIDAIQKHCIEAMSLWGYKMIDSEDTLKDTTFNPLRKFPFGSNDITTHAVQQNDEHSRNDFNE